MCVCGGRRREVEREKGKGREGRRGGVQIFKFDLVCTDTGREGGVWSIHLERRGVSERGGSVVL